MIDLYRRCNRLANVSIVENAIDVQRLANLKIRGIYMDERNEEDLTV